MKKVWTVTLMLVLSLSMAALAADKLEVMLKHKTHLELTDAQVSQLEALQLKLKKTMIQSKADIDLCKVDLAELKADIPANVKALEKKFQELGRLEADRNIAHVKIIAEAYALLTPEQIGKMDAMKMPHKGHMRIQKDDHGKMLFHIDEDLNWVEEEDGEHHVAEFIDEDGHKKVIRLRKDMSVGDADHIALKLEMLDDEDVDELDIKNGVKLWVGKESGDNEATVKIITLDGGEEHVTLKKMKKGDDIVAILKDIEGIDKEKMAKLIEEIDSGNFKILFEKDGHLEFIQSQDDRGGKKTEKKVIIKERKEK